MSSDRGKEKSGVEGDVRHGTEAVPALKPQPSRVSREELERRWLAVRSAMREEGIDVLISHAHYGGTAGYLRYLCDLTPSVSFGTTVVFPVDGGTTVIRHGAPHDLKLSGEDDDLRGVARSLAAPYFPSVGFTDAEEARLLVEALRPLGPGTVGLLGGQQISSSAVDAVRLAYPDAAIVDATGLVDPIRAVKSEEERTFIRATAALQDEAIAQVLPWIRPGLTERQVSVYLHNIVREMGGDMAAIHCRSAPMTESVTNRMVHSQPRTLAKGDMLHILVETNGPGGYFTHLTRTATLGTVRPAVATEHQFVLEAQQYTLDQIRPGALPSEINAAYRSFMHEHGRPEERRSYCHAQGYDVMERPVVSDLETLPIQAHMNVGCHPSYVHNGIYVWTCNNYLVEADRLERLHQFPTEIVEL